MHVQAVMLMHLSTLIEEFRKCILRHLIACESVGACVDLCWRGGDLLYTPKEGQILIKEAL